MKVEKTIMCKILLLIVFCLSQMIATLGLHCWECENVYSQQDCLNRGRMVRCKRAQNTCQITLRHGGWGDYPMIEKSCKQLSACGSNHIQDSHSASVYTRDTQCNMKPPSSVCRCCCGSDGCNKDILFCKGAMGGLPCPSIQAPKFGSMECKGDMMPFSVCKFKCKFGYTMVGSPVSTCNLFSKRDYPAPICKRIKCRKLKKHNFGRMTCTRSNNYRSKCRFACQSDYRLHGAAIIECIADMNKDAYWTWSRPQPKCKPLKCERQRLKNGKITCTNRNFFRSTCTFECDAEKQFQLYPATSQSNTCQRNEMWNRATPCCTLPCPPFALMDFIVVMDSSSSVGESNWNKMKNFIRLFLSDFSVREDATHFAVMRYNAAVDTQTQILLNDYPNSLEKVLEAFDRIPYDGSGTRTGNAINYTASTLLKVGNRPEARDVVLLITDGASQDDVVVPSANLHATGALVFVLPVLPPVGRLDLNEIRTIAKIQDNILPDALEEGFDALDEGFARRISSLLCSSPCG